MKAPSERLTAESLRQLVSYDPETGEFRRIVNGAAGPLAGGVAVIGYHRIHVGGERHWSHRLAWLYVHGEWPKFCIDHINGDRLDNRICNLREATIAQNLANRGPTKNNKSGFKGVFWTPRNKRWRARIGPKKHLGYFDTKEEAHQAYVAAAKTLYGEFAVSA